MTSEVVESTAYGTEGHFPARNVLVLGETDAWVGCCCNYWLAEQEKTAGQGFTLRVDNCTRMIAGCQIKNKGEGSDSARATKGSHAKPRALSEGMSARRVGGAFLPIYLVFLFEN